MASKSSDTKERTKQGKKFRKEYGKIKKAYAKFDSTLKADTKKLHGTLESCHGQGLKGAELKACMKKGGIDYDGPGTDTTSVPKKKKKKKK